MRADFIPGRLASVTGRATGERNSPRSGEREAEVSKVASMTLPFSPADAVGDAIQAAACGRIAERPVGYGSPHPEERLARGGGLVVRRAHGLRLR
jgi:hypothetical protein